MNIIVALRQGKSNDTVLLMGKNAMLIYEIICTKYNDRKEEKKCNKCPQSEATAIEWVSGSKT